MRALNIESRGNTGVSNQEAGVFSLISSSIPLFSVIKWNTGSSSECGRRFDGNSCVCWMYVYVWAERRREKERKQMLRLEADKPGERERLSKEISKKAEGCVSVCRLLSPGIVWAQPAVSLCVCVWECVSADARSEVEHSLILPAGCAQQCLTWLWC